MPRTCTICTHEQGEQIDAALLKGEPYRRIAQRFAASPDAVLRHKSHLPRTLAKAEEAREMVQAGTLLQRLTDLNAETLTILKEARQNKNGELALKAIARIEKQLELEGKLIGELNDMPVVNLNVSIENLQAVILNALASFPAAKIAVAQALMETKMEAKL
jgi:hypothetical protein